MALLHIPHWTASLFLLCIIFLSVLISLYISGHRLCVRSAKFRLSLSLSLYGLSYSSTNAVSISASHLQVCLRLPRIPNMTFLTVTIHEYDYFDTRHHVSTSKVHVQVHLLPVAPETFISVVLHDLRARISRSQMTPTWLQTMRQNLIRTVLNGKYLRLDDFKTQVIFRTRRTRRNANDAELDDVLYGKSCQLDSSEPSPVMESPNSDESVATLNASGWHMQGAQQRLYKFGSVHAQLRRSWDPKYDNATFVLIALDSSWVVAPHPSVENLAQKKPSWLVYLLQFLNKPLFVLKAFLSFPFALTKTIYDPASALTLYSSRIDVTFDHFRLRDAELVRQLWEYARRQYELLKEERGMDIKGFIQDMLVAGILDDTRRQNIF